MTEPEASLGPARSVRVLKGTLLILLNVPLLMLMYLGTFSRFLADDYCTHGTLVGQGFFGSQAYWYLNWSGRYSFTFMITLTQVFGPAPAPLLIALAAPLWLGVLVVSLRSVLAPTLGTRYWGQSLLLGSLILVATINGSSDLYQSFLWQTGLITYVIPLILGTAYGGWMISLLARDSSPRVANWQLAVSLVWTFAAGGFSETYVSMQTAGLLMLSIATFVPRWRSTLSPIRAVAVAGLFGSLLSMMVIIGAPGNEIRRSLMPELGDPVSILGWSVRHTLAFVAKSIIQAPVTTILALVLPTYATATLWPSAEDGPPQKLKAKGLPDLLLAIPAVSFILIFASVVPSVVATSAYPAERALITAQYALIFPLVLWGTVLGGWIRPSVHRWTQLHPRSRSLITALVLALTLVGGLATAQRIMGWIPDAREFAQTWDDRDAEIRDALGRGARDLEIASLSHMAGLAEVGSDPSEWINNCIASSYGLASVVAK